MTPLLSLMPRPRHLATGLLRLRRCLTRALNRALNLTLVGSGLAMASLGAAQAASPAAAALPEAPALNITVPEVTVTDQFGKPHRFGRDLVQGRTVLLNFVFTSCSTVCSPMTAVLKSVQDELQRRGRGDVLLLSVSVDPLTDTPEALARYAARFGVAGGWHFLTGPRTSIDAVLKGFGLPRGGAIDDHTPMVYITQAGSGRWSRAYGLAGPKPILQRVLGTAAEAAPAGTAATRSSRAWGGPDAVAVVPSAAVQRVASGASATAASAAPGPLSPEALRRIQGLAADQSRSARPVVLATGTEGAAGHFTNLPLMTQDRGPVRFYNDLIKGRVVLVSSFFTQCKDVCSPVTYNLVRTQQLLARSGGPAVQLVSISVDPVADTPELLGAYAQRHGAGPGWSFVTGKKENVDWVLHKLGLYVPEKNEHLAVLWAGNDRTGAWLKLHALAPPEAIADAVRKLQ